VRLIALKFALCHFRLSVSCPLEGKSFHSVSARGYSGHF
jgi:hypothetical protein